MRYVQKYLLNAVLAAAIISQIACKKDDDVLPSIASIAVTNAAFSTLEDAAVLGGVAGVLSNSNPGDPSGAYTVFAPDNAAFARLGLNSGADLAVLQRDFLTSTLLYHVSNGNLAFCPGAGAPLHRPRQRPLHQRLQNFGYRRGGVQRNGSRH